MKNLVLCILFSVVGVTQSWGQIQEASRFFNNTNYTAFRINIPKKNPGGGVIFFVFGNWKYDNLFRSLNTKSFFSTVDSESIVTSNRINFFLSNDKIGRYFVDGAEIQLDYAMPISILGYSLHTSEQDIKSRYYIVAYVLDNKFENLEDTVTWRLVAYFNPQLEMKGELVSYDGSYFIKGIYSYLDKRSSTIKKSSYPSVFLLEKTDQNVIAVINIFSQKVLWQVDDLSYSDQTAVGIFTGVFNSMRFSLGRDGNLAKEKYYIDRKESKKEKRVFLFSREDILLPDQLEE